MVHKRLLLEHCLPDAADRRVVLLDSPARLFSFTAVSSEVSVLRPRLGDESELLCRRAIKVES